MRKPTPQEVERLDAMAQAVMEHITYLFVRWEDERQYEDWVEYETSMKAHLPEGFRFIAGLKEPFGFTFTIGTKDVFQLYCSEFMYGWTPVKVLKGGRV